MLCTRRWLPVMGALILAAALWFVTFGLEWGNFWIKISASALSLSVVALVLGPRPERPRIHAVDILLGLGSAVVLYGAFWLGNWLSDLLFSFADGQVSSIYAKGEGTSRWAICLLLLTVTGPSEEIFWRGFLQRRLQLHLGGFLGWAFATLAYALVHLSAWNFMLIGAALVAGAFWGLVYWRLGRLFPVIISHAVWSVLVFIVAPIS